MSNEQLIVYLLSLINNLNIAIDKTMDNLPEEVTVERDNTSLGIAFGGPQTITTYPVLDPILEFKESLYEQLEALKGAHKS